MSDGTAPAIEVKDLSQLTVAGIRMRGRYEESGKAFRTLYRHAGRYAQGKPMCLYYDAEYRETDADFEPCVAVRDDAPITELDVHTIEGGRCLSLLHYGPYDELHRSYQRLRDYLNEHDCKPRLPSREIYLKGPGMLFRGNPKKYITEIQIPIE